MRSSWFVLLGSALLALAACGARITFVPGEAAAEGGRGGAGAGSTTITTTSSGGAGSGSTTTSTTTSTTASTTTSTATGGAGGAVDVACDALVVDGPPLSPNWAVGNKQWTPWLARIEPDGSRAALVYLEAQNPFQEYQYVSSVGLHDPWGIWPSDIGTTAPHVLTNGFVVGPARSGRFSLLTSDEPNGGNAPTGMFVWAPNAGISGATGQFFDDVPPGFPAFVTSNGDDHLAGFQRLVANNVNHLALGRVNLDGAPLSFGDPVACALGGVITGAAIPFGGGFLATLSNGRPFGHCLTDDLTDGPPARVQIVSLPGAPANGTLLFEEDEPESEIYQTHLAPAQGGAWAAWERIPFAPPIERRIELLRLDGAGLPASGNILEVSYGMIAAPFAIAALGSRVAIATVSAAGDLEVRVLSEDGALLAQASFTPESGFALDLSVALLASPAQDRLLVAWSESSAINNDDQRVRVARLACAGGL